MYTPKYFSLHELCKTSQNVKSNFPGTFGIVQNLAFLAFHLDKIRELFGQPITINSAFRSIEVNNLVHGVPSSYHLSGRAADITCRRESFSELVKSVNTYLGRDTVFYDLYFENHDFEVIIYPQKHFIHFAVKHYDTSI